MPIVHKIGFDSVTRLEVSSRFRRLSRQIIRHLLFSRLADASTSFSSSAGYLTGEYSLSPGYIPEAGWHAEMSTRPCNFAEFSKIGIFQTDSSCPQTIPNSLKTHLKSCLVNYQPFISPVLCFSSAKSKCFFGVPGWTLQCSGSVASLQSALYTP